MHDSVPLTFFESIGNLKPQVRQVTGRTPSTGVASDIAVCLQQGRLFFEAAKHNPLEIRPLLLFYGTMAFAKAIIVIRTVRPLATLSHGHGLRDVSEPLARIPQLAVRIDKSGTFGGFNDVIAGLNRLKYTDTEMVPRSIQMPAAPTNNIVGMRLSLKAILSRIPGLSGLYARTFGEPSLAESIHLNSTQYWAADYWELQISDLRVFRNRADLNAIIANWCERFPALQRWRVLEALRAYGDSIITFGNVPVPDDELDDAVLTESTNQFSVRVQDVRQDAMLPKTSLAQALSPLGGSFSFGTSLINPFGDVYMSEYALHYLGMYLLSSLVRYRPQMWVHAVTRSIAPDVSADDHALALLEDFMTLHPTLITGMTLQLLGVGD